MDAALMERLAGEVRAAPPALPDRELQDRLRAAFDGLRVVVCSDDDVPPRVPAAFENDRCRLYYLDAGAHCVTLTRDAESASGVVVGLIGDDPV